MKRDSNKKSKHKTSATTKADTATKKDKNTNTSKENQTHCPLLAKDSEWIDIVQTAYNAPSSSKTATEDETVVQLVECEDGPQTKPLAIMFPGIADKDPETLEGVINKAMSTTEVTKRLVDLGQKANFEFMIKSDRLIPTDKKWLESVTESSNSVDSLLSEFTSSTTTTEYEADYEPDADPSNHKKIKPHKRKKKKVIPSYGEDCVNEQSSQGTLCGNENVTEIVYNHKNSK